MSTVFSAGALPAVLLLLSLGACDAAPADPPSAAAGGEEDSGSGDSGQADPGPVDADGDGVSVDDDCDDTRADTYPGAYEPRVFTKSKKSHPRLAEKYEAHYSGAGSS